MFGLRFQECRLKLQPFRAVSVRIVSKDYSSTYLEELLIEVGGLDYLEGLFVCLFVFCLVSFQCLSTGCTRKVLLFEKITKISLSGRSSNFFLSYVDQNQIMFPDIADLLTSF